MKLYSLILIFTFTCNAEDGKIDPYRYRPYAEFYEKGKEGSRMDKYIQNKDSDVSKEYLKLFSSKDYDKLEIFQVSNYHRINNQITLDKMSLYATFGENSPIFKEFIEFFKKAFPENVRRLPDENSKSQILVFSGEAGNCVVYVPGVLGPEFAIVNVRDEGLKIGKTYDISNFAMSATPPFKYFWEMYSHPIQHGDQARER